jgi:hypothetical protein
MATKRTANESPRDNLPNAVDALYPDFSDMDDEDFEAFLMEAIDTYATVNEAPIKTIATFKKARVSKKDKGVVLRIGKGEFHITFVRKR